MLPIDPAKFAVAAERVIWRRDHGMEVFSFWDPNHARPTVDIFVRYVVPFADLWEESQLLDFEGVSIRVASI